MKKITLQPTEIDTVKSALFNHERVLKTEISMAKIKSNIREMPSCSLDELKDELVLTKMLIKKLEAA